MSTLEPSEGSVEVCVTVSTVVTALSTLEAETLLCGEELTTLEAEILLCGEESITLEAETSLCADEYTTLEAETLP